MQNILWLYWEDFPGKSTYPHITLCRKIIQYQCADIDVRLVTPDNLDEYLPEVHSNLHKIHLVGDDAPCLAIKTAFIRAFLLEKYGGIYLDSDAIPLKSLKFVFQDIERHGFVAMRRTSAVGKHISIGFMGAAPGGKIITAYANTLRNKIELSSGFAWGEVGAYTLTPIVNDNSDACFLYPEKDVHPVVAEEQYMFMDKYLELDEVLEQSAFIFMLYHRPFTGPSAAIPSLGVEANKQGWLYDCSEECLYQSKLLVSKVIRCAFPYHVAKRQLQFGIAYRLKSTLKTPFTTLKK